MGLQKWDGVGLLRWHSLQKSHHYLKMLAVALASNGFIKDFARTGAINYKLI
jgi:hypothetical protein